MTVEASEVKARISLRDLFERDGHVLKRSGASLVCLSPFGQEKTPSCYVHEKEGFFKCFSSGLGGDCFVYWQNTRKCDFSAAIEALAAIAGVAPGLTPGPVVMVKQ
ncbi:MAG: CHC2 zinc finger domain-containing protein, partial [Verrucomicrobiia bacterium]